MWIDKNTFFLTLMFFLFGITNVAAQSGQIRGIIVDRVTEEPLIGVNVGIEGTSMGSPTDVDGMYVINRVPAGTYTIIASSIGYKRFSAQVEVAAGETLDFDIIMDQEAVEGEAVIISAQAKGQIAAINEQISSNTISNVVSAERIKDIPDANVAESVGRLPGISIKRSGGEGQKVTIRGLSPKYNVMAVNGVRMQSSDPNDRSVDLNMIAPNALSGIEVKKALTADMDADAVGGTVNLKINKAPEGFRKNFSYENGYAGLANENRFGNFKGNLSVSNRFLDSKLGIQSTGFYQSYDRSSDNITAGYGWHGAEDDINNFWLENVSISDVITDRKRYGGSLVLDYQLSKGSIMYTGFASQLYNHSIVQQNSFGASSRTWSGYASDTESKTTVFNNAMQGDFDFDLIKMDFSVSHALTQMRIPNQIFMSMGPYNGGTLLPGWSNPDEESRGNEVHMTAADFINVVETSTTRQIKYLRTLKRENDVSAISASVNFEMPFNLGDYLAGSLKFGGKFVQNERINDETRYSIDAATGINVAAIGDSVRGQWEDYFGYALTDLDGNGFQANTPGIPAQFFMDSNYDVGDFLSGLGIKKNIFTNPIDISRMRDLEEFARNSVITYNTGSGYETNPMYQKDPLQSFQNDYNYQRNFSAFYLMPTFNIGKSVTFIPGIRYEKFDFDYTAYDINVRDRANYPGDQSYYTLTEVTWDSTKAETWFPQIHLRIKPFEWFDIRLAATESIIYPDYRAISPYLYYDSFSLPILRLGNPYLKPATSKNYDVYASVYENHIGLFTAGYFIKEIDDLIVPVSYRTKDASLINNRFDLVQSVLTSVNTWTNLEDPTTVNGFELDWQTNFWYLPSVLQGLVLSVNYTRINSESQYKYLTTKKTGNPPFQKISYQDTTRSGRLVDQPDNIMNVTVGYDIGGFSARLSYLYQDDVLESANNTYASLDERSKAYSRWDFTSYYRLPKVEGMQIFLNINNITNEADLRYRNNPSYLSRGEYYGTTAQMGVRYDF